VGGKFPKGTTSRVLPDPKKVAFVLLSVLLRISRQTQLSQQNATTNGQLKQFEIAYPEDEINNNDGSSFEPAECAVPVGRRTARRSLLWQ
jgi:hypothetical protein